MVIALNIVLAPVFLKILISDNGPVSPFAGILLTVSFSLVMLLLMFLVRRSHAYKSKTHWRVVHHSLLALAAVFLLSLLVPLSFAPFAEIPARFLVWALALAAMPLFQRLGSGVVPNLAQPQRAGQAASSTSSSSAGPAHSSSSNSYDRSVEEKEGQEGHRRPPRRGGRGHFRRHSGPSRRRM
jgi:hypothetical protein